MESPALVLLILATCALSMVAFNRPDLEERWIFRPDLILAAKEYYRLVTPAFIHAGWGHLLLNMYTLYQFGGIVVWIFGAWKFLLLYFVSILSGGLLSLYLHRNHDYAALGASGGVCGVMFAYVLNFPTSRMVLFPLPFGVSAWLYAMAFILASFYALKGQRDNIGHDAHLGGAVSGLLMAALLRPDLLRQHWIVFFTVMGIAALIFAYLIGNPLFLPLAAYFPSRNWPARKAGRPPGFRRRVQAAPPRIVQTRPPPIPATPPERADWLIREIEHQVGPLRKDPSGAHDWIDQFDRVYDVIKAKPEAFNHASFTKEVLDRLQTPGVRFVIVDLRELPEAAVDRLRPFFADLPDEQFKRILRSFAFKPPKPD